MQTVWGDDERFVDTYCKSIPGKQLYSTFDWGIRDGDGYYFILGRTDDVINVAGHRLGTREIEESRSHPAVAEVAVIGVADPLKGQVASPSPSRRTRAPSAHADARSRLEGELMGIVDRQLGAVARPSRVHFVARCQDPFRQGRAPLDTGGVRTARSRRRQHHRGPDGPHQVRASVDPTFLRSLHVA